MKKIAVVVAVLLLSVPSFAADSLRIVSAGPVGEVAALAEANEIRVVFSEPMVVIGKIPQPVVAPFFHIEPAVRGSLRWSGTTTLIFTPEAQLPFASDFKVSVDATATAISGARLDQAYSWTFTTPTIRLLRTEWYRKGGKIGDPVVIALRFNQPVSADTILPHLRLRTVGHEFKEAPLPDAGVERLRKLEPQGLEAYEAKRVKAQAALTSDDQPVLSFAATEWDKKRFKPAPDLVVLETKPGIPPGTSFRITLDEKLVQSPRHPAPGAPQTFTIEVEPPFFVTGIDCAAECDPETSNGINFRAGDGVRFEDARKAITVTDITDPAHETVVKPKLVTPDYDYPAWNYSLDELGYTTVPAHRYAVRVDPSLTSVEGQALGYPWMAVVQYWHKSAFVSFGSGHGVWETSGGPVLPFHARNFRSVKQWLAPLTVERLMPVMLQLRTSGFNTAPDVTPQTRKLNLTPDKISAIGLDLKPAIGPDNMGLAWAAVQPGEAMSKTKVYDSSVVATVVQATNLGISVKDSPQNSVILVTRLDDAQPVAGAEVSIRDTANAVFWSGVTDADGIAVAPKTDLRRKKAAKGDPGDRWEDTWSALNELHFVVIARKDGDVAYVGSDWNEGLSPWDFEVEWDVNEADPQLRGKVFADRGVYKLGEEVHFKAVVRADTPDGMRLVPAGTKLNVTLVDSQNGEVDSRTVETNAWSSAEWTVKIPSDSPLGTYTVSAQTSDQRGSVHGELLVAAYRRPEFRVDTTLTSNDTIAGTKLAGTATGRYLFGAPMANAEVRWTYTKERADTVPDPIQERWPIEQWSFVGSDYYAETDPGRVTISEGQKTLDAKGELHLTLDTDKTAGWPMDYQLEAVVTDVTRQEIAGRDTFHVDPAPWYVGLKTPPFFVDQAGLDTAVVAAGLDGLAVPGVKVKVELQQLQWSSVRQSEGEGFYGWESERKEVPAGEWTITTTADAVPLHVPISDGGEYILKATASDAEGHSSTTLTVFYVIGDGYTAWERYDHNRIDLVPEKKTYKPGETARIMVKSPWEKATALLTTEREGVRTWKRFELTSTQQTIEVPVTEKEIPNVFVSVLLLKGRTKQDVGKDGSDPGKPAFRLGYVELSVEDSSKKLQVDVAANAQDYRPASKAKINVTVKDAAGRPSQSEVTLWAVDYGVLSLTSYETPDILPSIYLDKALEVSTEDSRQRIISRRVLTPKGASDGGGGGRDAGVSTLRKDFRVLAFWVGSLVTDANGKAQTEVTLPESLTTYRIMAVAGDRQSRFGWAQNEIKINKPLMLTPAWPRFLAVGDKAHFGGVIHNQLKKSGKATVTIESLDPGVLALSGPLSQTVTVQPNTPIEVRFDAEAKAVGEARLRMRVSMGREKDAMEDVIPVRLLVSPETVASYGEAKPQATETFEVPAGVVPSFGGLRIDLSSTAMVGLSEGARYLVEYPYGCAEQRSSRALALMLVSDLGAAFPLSGVDPGKERPVAQKTLDELPKFQCGDGGFAFWMGDCSSSSPYLTSWVLHVFQRGQKLKYDVDKGVLDRAYGYLESNLGKPRPDNEGWMPAYTAWQAFAVKVLAEGGRNVDSHLTRLYDYRERMPLFGISFLLDAMQARGEKSGARVTELRRRLTNAIQPEGGFAHVEELTDPYLLWFWNSNIRTTAIVLGSVVRAGGDEELVTRMVRWMMAARKDGRWGNTQENAWAMESLVDYYRKYEAVEPNFLGTVTLGGSEIAHETFQGRSTVARSKVFSMQDVLQKGQPGAKLPIVFTREGAGTLFYMTRFRYAQNVLHHEGLEQGFHVDRSYSVQGSGGKAATTFKAGDLIEVTLHIRNSKERRYVAITDPVPAGTEPVEAWFSTTASKLAQEQRQSESREWWEWWQEGGWDHVERHDDRVHVFATRLSEGDHLFTYLVRATTAGTFITAPTHVEEMYEPEVFGRTATDVVEVQK